jgi:hypothetical protein
MNASINLKNVKVYPYIEFNGGGIGPVLLPVIENAKGTYSFATFGRNVSYGLKLSDGKQLEKLVLHNKYFAVGEDDNGGIVTTHWMYCTDDSKTPSFGLTTQPLTTLSPSDSNSDDFTISVPPYIVLGALTDVNVSHSFPSPAIGQTLLIANATGNIIASKVGTPHVMGVLVKGGKRFGLLLNGLKNIMITGKDKDGNQLSFTGETCLDGRDPAIFFRLFP